MSTKISEPSFYDSSVHQQTETKTGRSWAQRTFGEMEQGSLRGNIFLLCVSTIGCSFFYLPYYAKEVGLLMLIVMIIIPGLISYYSSSLLYIGFKHTKAQTYDEVMKGILGPKVGYLTNLVIFLHAFSSVISGWTFSYKVIVNTLSSLYNVKDYMETKNFKFFYFTGIMLFMFASSLSDRIERLKFVSMLGLGIILYMAIVFTLQCPRFYNHYNREDFVIENFKVDFNFFEAWGMCFYLYLNQYTILPICNNVKQLTSKRMSKVLGRTTLSALVLYIVITVVGYFSWPSYDTIVANNFDKLFILRSPIPGMNDSLIIAGKFMFAFYLLIGIMVRGYFFLIYFTQLRLNTMKIFRGENVQPLTSDEVEEITPNERLTMTEAKMRKSEAAAPRIEDAVEIYIEPLDEFSTEEQQETVANEQETKETKDTPKITLTTHAINLSFLTLTMVLTVFVAESLNTFLSVVGGFVALLEIVVFPLIMILAIDRKTKMLGRCEKPTLIIVSVFLILLGVTSSCITIYKKLTEPIVAK